MKFEKPIMEISMFDDDELVTESTDVVEELKDETDTLMLDGKKGAALGSVLAVKFD